MLSAEIASSNSAPDLLSHAKLVANFKKAVLTVFMNDSDKGKPVEYYRIDLEDVIVTSHSIGHGGSDRAVETLTLHFNMIKWTYTPQKRDSPGAGSGKVAGSWNLEKNTK